MNILITGGAGFIGSHLTDTLLRSGNRVICVDNFELGTRDTLTEALTRADFFLAEGTAADADFLSEIMQKYQIEIIPLRF